LSLVFRLPKSIRISYGKYRQAYSLKLGQNVDYFAKTGRGADKRAAIQKGSAIFVGFFAETTRGEKGANFALFPPRVLRGGNDKVPQFDLFGLA
jgi:hypothetical protein